MVVAWVLSTILARNEGDTRCASSPACRLPPSTHHRPATSTPLQLEFRDFEGPCNSSDHVQLVVSDGLEVDLPMAGQDIERGM